MLELKDITIKEFKKDIYNDYCLLFPKDERKNYKTLKKNYNDNILKIYKIEDSGTYIGFMIFNHIDESKILQFDYFGILPKYQDKGYGSKSIELLKTKMKEYSYIYGEVEKPGLGKSIEENNLRERRIKFYQKLGFYRLKYDLELYKVIYIPICLNINIDEKLSDEKIIEEAFKIYFSILGKRNIIKNCKIIK